MPGHVISMASLLDPLGFRAVGQKGSGTRLFSVTSHTPSRRRCPSASPARCRRGGPSSGRLDALLVADDRKRARPVCAPQAALEPPGVEYAGQRVPDVRERIRLLRQRAGAGDLDHRILTLGEFHHFWKIGPGLWRRRRYARLLDAHMVDDEPRVGAAVDQRRARVHVAPEWDVDREIVFNGRAQNAVEPRIVRRALRLFRQDDADADRAGIFFQSAMTSATAGSSGLTGLTRANLSGWARSLIAERRLISGYRLLA